MVNRNGELKLVIMTKDIFNEYFRIRKANGELDIEKYFGIKNQNYELEAITIQKLKIRQRLTEYVKALICRFLLLEMVMMNCM